MGALQKFANHIRPSANAAVCGLIGVHFARNKLHLVQLENDSSATKSLRACLTLPFAGSREQLLESPKTVSKLLRRALKQGRFRGRQVVSALPSEHVKIMSISHPAVSPEAEPSTIAQLMADRVDGELSDYVIDYVPVRTSVRDGERLCMVAISRRQHVFAYLDILAQAGLRVESLEVAPIAVRRLIESMGSPSKIENVLVINTNENRTYLTLISGRRLLSNQEIQFGEAQLINTIVRTLEISAEAANDHLTQSGLRVSKADADDPDMGIGNTLLEIVRPELLKLVHEIERAFLFAASESYGDSNKRIYLFGGIARWPGADQLLSSLAQLPVDTMSMNLLPFETENDETNEPDYDHAAEIAVASGLALWGMRQDD